MAEDERSCPGCGADREEELRVYGEVGAFRQLVRRLVAVTAVVALSAGAVEMWAQHQFLHQFGAATSDDTLRSIAADGVAVGLWSIVAGLALVLSWWGMAAAPVAAPLIALAIAAATAPGLRREVSTLHLVLHIAVAVALVLALSVPWRVRLARRRSRAVA